MFNFHALGKIATSPRPERAASGRNESDCSTLPLLLVVPQTFMVVQTAYCSGSQQVRVSQDLSVFQSKKPQSAHGFRLIGNHAHGQQLSNLQVYLSGEDWQRGVSVCSPYTSTSGTATEELFLCYHPIEHRNTSSTRHRFLGGRQELGVGSFTETLVTWGRVGKGYLLVSPISGEDCSQPLGVCLRRNLALRPQL